jgi:hypothetical protein
MSVRTWVVAAVAAGLLLAGAGVAYVTGSGDEEGYYEVEITRDDGSQVDVHLDRNLNVLDSPAGHEDEG